MEVPPTNSPTTNKHRKARNKKERNNPTTVTPSELRIFEWKMKHQEAFDALKEALSAAPVLGYPNFSREFIMEIDASLNGLGTVVSQQGKDGQIHVIAYASHSLHPSKRSMHNYSSVKLELLALKWVVMETFRDYLLGSQFQVYMETICSPMSWKANWEHHKSNGLVSWHCLILSSSTKQADPTGLQMH